MNGAFPVSHDFSTVPARLRMSWPRSVPWEMVEQWREQIEASHHRTLEQLAHSGGLTPVELWLASRGHGPSEQMLVTEHVAVRWLIAELAK